MQAAALGKQRRRDEVRLLPLDLIAEELLELV
jgi:hypothetical protein